MRANLYDVMMDLQNELEEVISALEYEVKAIQSDGYDSTSLEEILEMIQDIYKFVK